MKTFAALLTVSCAFLIVKGQVQDVPKPLGHFPRPPAPFAPFNSFTNQGLNDIVNCIISQAASFKAQMSNRGLNTNMVTSQVRKMFNIYNQAVEAAGSCATVEMKALPDEALTDVLSCIPSDEDLQQKKEEAKQKFDALLAELKIADDEITAINDEFQKQVKTAETQWKLVVPFFKEVTENMYNGITKIHQCMNSVRTNVQEQVFTNLALLESCPQQ